MGGFELGGWVERGFGRWVERRVEEGERFGEGKERFGFLGLFAIKI
jgi:hypothetical protein